MAIRYEDSFVLLREASDLIDEALDQEDELTSSGKIRAAFYRLYQAANTATMVSPPDVRMAAESSERYRRIVEYPYRLYYQQGRYPNGELRAVFDRWLDDVRGYVDDLSAQSKLSVVKPSRAKL